MIEDCEIYKRFLFWCYKCRIINMKSKHLVIDANGKNGEFNKLEDIKDFISVENVQIKNLNSVPFTDWSLVNKFSNLRTLSLSNCLVDKKSFFEGISSLSKLSELCVDDYCFFKNVEEKVNKKNNPKHRRNTIKLFGLAIGLRDCNVELVLTI